NADRADTRPAAAVRNAEGLVQVQVTDVGVLGDARPANQRVEVGAVEIDQAAGFVYLLTDFDHGFLEHAVRGRVGDHQGSQALAMLVDLPGQIFQVDVALAVAFDHHDFHPRH